ncbi:RluA family pseudouridine synthase [Actinoalloteichus hymeniacidonis]|uniref:RNA pseudouridylate synthase n=1 Tax=Actinoalloteichus hymeniacidonis TaxID=340345 RepID=A0AAC9HQS8_9PSEU|nr:RluA family pseudouridine synthase [Actinoalloteichus hymeniacidonis]AOS63862.1 23S RNA-specific pseudouridylate synthase [Actinoalloteichus hymeniacidonis]MBB5908082.1 tRNA pseudouridine32 synthase/23S rRNA pseudouridine746 synthase [Actinoalloteichus hymeniacidonis]
MRRKLASPLPQRHGLDAARLWLPPEGSWATIRDHLVERLPRVDPARIDAMLVGQEIIGMDGPVKLDAPYRPDSFVWFHRDLPVEVPVPFEIRVLHRDEDLVVVDKPHFLATIPRGRHVVETALVRLRRELDLPELSPAHRLDRVTAGLVMFVVRRERRGVYQTMFRDRRVFKEYEAIAEADPALRVPRTVRSRIVKERGIINAQEVEGPPNSESVIELLAERSGLGRYRLLPKTGRTHQLRLHMSSLGVPILGDDFYPTLVETALDDFRRPLQLLAKVLEFTDPITGEPRRFESRSTLTAWTSYADWAGDDRSGSAGSSS